MPPLNRTQKMNIVELQRMNILDLQELAKKLEVVDCTSLRKQELIFSILKHQTEPVSYTHLRAHETDS